jgi:ribosomal protein S21
MMQFFLGMRTAFLMRSNTAAIMLGNFHSRRCFHSSLLLCERRHHRASSSPNTKQKKRKNNRKRSKARRNRRAQELEASKQEWLPQDGDTSSLAKTMPAETRTSLPLELWSKRKADATFFHGRDGLAVQWSSPSVQTSQHASVKTVLQDIQQSK